MRWHRNIINHSNLTAKLGRLVKSHLVLAIVTCQLRLQKEEAKIDEMWREAEENLQFGQPGQLLWAHRFEVEGHSKLKMVRKHNAKAIVDWEKACCGVFQVPQAVPDANTKEFNIDTKGVMKKRKKTNKSSEAGGVFNLIV